MTTRSHYVFTAVLLVMVPFSLRAQIAQPSSTSKDESSNRQVIGSVSETRVRFTCLGSLIQLRLEVFGAAGEVLFDSEFKPGNAVDWSATDVKGQQLGDGTYLCVVSVKDATGEILRKQAIAAVRDQSVSLREADKSLLSSAQSASVITGEDVNVTIVETGGVPTAILAHDGATAHLVSGRGGLTISSGDFFANRLLEHMRITAEGNVGIGVASPQARLDVAGAIRASQGIIFPDGSIQFSAARKTFGTASLRDGQSKDKSGEGQGIHPEIAGTGTTGQIPKWVDGPSGLLGDSVMSELNGSIGINGPPNPIFKLDVNGHNRFRGSNVSFYLTGAKVGGNEWLFQTVDADGRLRIFDNTSGAERFSMSQSGNVGIGAPSPTSKLEIAGSALIYPASGPGTLHIRNRSLSDFSQVVFDDNNNAYRGYIGYIGFNASLDAVRKDTVEFGTQGTNMTFRPNEVESMRLTTTGKVGIGTTAPTYKLTVVDSSNTAMGLRVATDVAGGTVASFGGFGKFQIDSNGTFGTAGGRLTVMENGEVYIRIADPEMGIAALTVNGSIRSNPPSGGDIQACLDYWQRLARCSSSIRYKHNINSFSPGLSLINRLRPVSFTWKASNHEDMGLVAEEVAEVEPLLVTHNDKGEVEGVKYDRVGVVLINAIKEQQAQISDLQNQLKQQRLLNEIELRHINALAKLVRINRARNPRRRSLPHRSLTVLRRLS